MNDARHENARTLAAAIGSAEEEAAELLDTMVLLTVAPRSKRLGETLHLLLGRTLTNIITAPDPTVTPALEIVVGAIMPRTATRTVSVSTSGSKFAVSDGGGTSLSGQRPPTAIVDLLAACYATAAAIQRTAGLELPMPLRLPIEVDVAELLEPDYAQLSGAIDLGMIYLAGAGAIGNGFLLGLSAFDVCGELHICDPDTVSSGNLNRCVWFTTNDIGKNKAHQLALHAQPQAPRLRLVPHGCVLRDLPAARAGGAWLDTLVVAVDSRRARRSLQNELPRRVFDASTTGLSEVVLHFNQSPSAHACLSCIYHEAPDETAHEQHVAKLLGVTVGEVRSNFVSTAAAQAILRQYPDLDASKIIGSAYDSLFKQLCGQGALKTAADKQVLAPFAFVSVLAGVLLAVELVRRVGKSSIAQPFNYWRASPWSAPVVRARELRPKRHPCEFCDNPTLQRVVRELWSPNGK